MAKFKVGDKVRIKRSIGTGYGKRYLPTPKKSTQGYVCPAMARMRGQTAAITEVVPLVWREKPAYRLDIDGDGWSWWGYTLERIEE